MSYFELLNTSSITDTPAPSGCLLPNGVEEKVEKNEKRPRINKDNLEEASTSDLILALARKY